MSVIITISDDGHIDATHNSGRTLWSCEVDSQHDDSRTLARGIYECFIYAYDEGESK